MYSQCRYIASACVVCICSHPITNPGIKDSNLESTNPGLRDSSLTSPMTSLLSRERSRAGPRCWSGPWGPQGSHCMEGSIRAQRRRARSALFSRVYELKIILQDTTGRHCFLCFVQRPRLVYTACPSLLSLHQSRRKQQQTIVMCRNTFCICILVPLKTFCDALAEVGSASITIFDGFLFSDQLRRQPHTSHS